MAFQRVFVRYRTESGTGYDIFLRMVVEYGEPWKVEEGRRSCISITVKCRSPRHRKNLRVLPLLPQAQRQIRPRQQKYQLFTLYQIRNKRMTWRTLRRCCRCVTANVWLMVFGGAKMLEDLRANSWSLRPCCMVLAIVLLIFVRCGAKRTSSTICGGPAAGAVSHYHRMLFRL